MPVGGGWKTRPNQSYMALERSPEHQVVGDALRSRVEGCGRLLQRLSQRRDAPRGPSSDSCAIHNYASVIVTAILYVVLRPPTLQNGTCIWNFSPAAMQIYFA
jgi:hypothetical protein